MVAIGVVEIQGNFGDLFGDFNKLQAELQELTAAAVKFATSANFDPANKKFQQTTARIKEVNAALTATGTKAKKGLDIMRKEGALTEKQYKKLASQLGIVTKEANKVAGAARRVKGAQDKARGSTAAWNLQLGSLRKTVQFLGTVATRALQIFLGYQAIRITRETIRDFAEFQRSISTLGVISGATEEQLRSLTEQASDLAKQTKFTTSEVVDAQVELSRAGLKTNDILNATSAVLDTAAVAQIDAAAASKILVSTLNQFGLEASKATEVADTLTVATLNSAQTIEELGQALKLAGPTAAAVGLTLTETAQIIGVLADNGINATVAGTQIRRVMLSLANITPRAASAFKSLGVEINETTLSGGGFKRILEQLAEAGVGTSVDLATLGDAAAAFTARGVNAINTLSREVNENGGSFDRLGEALANSAGAARDTANAIQDNLAGAFDRLRSTFEAVAFKNIEESGLGSFLTGAVNLVRKTIEEIDNAIPIYERVFNDLERAVTGRNFGEQLDGLDLLATSTALLTEEEIKRKEALQEQIGFQKSYLDQLRELATLNVGEEAAKDLGKWELAWKGFNDVWEDAFDNLVDGQEGFQLFEQDMREATLATEEMKNSFENADDLVANLVAQFEAFTKLGNEEGLGRVRDSLLQVFDLVKTGGPVSEETAASLAKLANGFLDGATEGDQLNKRLVTMLVELRNVHGAQIEVTESGRAAAEATKTFEERLAALPETAQKFVTDAADAFTTLQEKSQDLTLAIKLVNDEFGESSPQAAALKEEIQKVAKEFKELGLEVPLALAPFVEETKAAKKAAQDLQKTLVKLKDSSKDIFKTLIDDARKFNQELAKARVNPDLEDANKSLEELNKKQQELIDKGALTVDEQNELNDVTDKLSKLKTEIGNIDEQIIGSQEEQALNAERIRQIQERGVELAKTLRDQASKISDEYSDQSRALLAQANLLEGGAAAGALRGEQLVEANLELQRVTENITREQEKQAAAQKKTSEAAKTTTKTLEDGTKVIEEVAKGTQDAADAAGELADGVEKAADAQKELSEEVKAFEESAEGTKAYGDELARILDLLEKIKACLAEINR